MKLQCTENSPFAIIFYYCIAAQPSLDSSSIIAEATASADDGSCGADAGPSPPPSGCSGWCVGAGHGQTAWLSLKLTEPHHVSGLEVTVTSTQLGGGDINVYNSPDGSSWKIIETVELQFLPGSEYVTNEWYKYF